MKNEVKIALNICTYQREEYIYRNLSLLQSSYFLIGEKQSIMGNCIFLLWIMRGS